MPDNVRSENAFGQLSNARLSSDQMMDFSSGNVGHAELGYDPTKVSLRSVTSRKNPFATETEFQNSSHPIDISVSSQSIMDSQSSSLSYMKAGTTEHSELMLGVSGRSDAQAGGVTSYHGNVHGIPRDNTGYVSTNVHYPTKGRSDDQLNDRGSGEASESFENAAERQQRLGNSSFVSRMQFDATYRGEPSTNEFGLSDDRRGSMPGFADCEFGLEGSKSAEIRRQKSLKRYGNEAEQFEFANCESDFDAVKRASLRRTSWQVGHEGGLGFGVSDGEQTREAMRRGVDYDRAEEGGLAAGMNYGVKVAGMRRSEWDKAEEGGFGAGMNFGVRKAGMRTTDCYNADEGGFGIGMNSATSF